MRLLALLEKIPDRAGKEDVHRLRTTVRRLEVQLGKCPPKTAKILKRLRRKAGVVRDIDVHLGLLEPAPTPSARPDALSEGWKELREILKTERSRHLGSLRDLVAESAPLLATKLPTLVQRSTAGTATAAEAHRRCSRARERFLQWTRTIPDDPERLHRLRINTKNLRYSLEPLAGYAEPAELAARLKQVQDAIGNWHDWATLQQLAEKELSSPAAGPVCAALGASTARQYRKAHRAAQSARIWIMLRKPVASVHGAAATPQQIGHTG
jgi:CHAD domain-containing protein